MKKKHILLTNDDGVNAPGIYHLWKALKEDYQVTVVAPTFECSGSSLSITLHQPLNYRKVVWPDEGTAFAVNGKPVDCIKIGLNYLIKEPVDLVVSGINPGSNLGRNFLYSGTVGAIIEASHQGYRGIAFSSESIDPKYEEYLPYIKEIIDFYCKLPFSHTVFLNVGLPHTDKKIQGIKATSQGISFIRENIEERIHPTGSSYFWLGAKRVYMEEKEDADIPLVEKGYITLTPLSVLDSTDYTALQELNNCLENSSLNTFV